MFTLNTHHLSEDALTCLDEQLAADNSGNFRWFGIGIGLLDLPHRVTKEVFRSLAENLHPISNEPLVRSRTKRRRKAIPLFTEVVITLPRLVGELISSDREIASAHDSSSDAAMKELEIFAAASILRSGIPFLAVSGNVVGVAFDRLVSRFGRKLPQTRYLLFNATLVEDDGLEEWEELNPVEMVDALPYAVDLYLERLRDSIPKLGGISAIAIERFERNAQNPRRG